MENNPTQAIGMNPQEPDSSDNAARFAHYVRMGGWLALGLIGLWLWEKLAGIATHDFPWLVWTNLGFVTIYGVWMVLPWSKWSPKTWKFGMIGFCVASVLFVFLMIANIMVDASAAGAMGERLGVPGIEGAIMFLSLAQIPGILFRRHPEMMV
jgi:hypothetical protein